MPSQDNADKLRHNPTWASNKAKCAKCGTLLETSEKDGDTPKTITVTVTYPSCNRWSISGGHLRWPSLSPEEGAARRRRSAIRGYNDHLRWWYEKR